MFTLLSLLFFPHRWLESIDASPGFNQCVLKTLKAKILESREFYEHCSLMLDAMSLKQLVEFDHHKGKMVGFVDPPIGDAAEEAKEALVLMVVGLRGHWKMPIGYFLTRVLSATEQSQLILQALSLLHEAGHKVVSITMDGHASNIAMCRLLGCTFEANNIVSHFMDPASKNLVCIFFDACHMLKLTRNMLEGYQIIQTPAGNASWAYVRLLQEVQVSLLEQQFW